MSEPKLFSNLRAPLRPPHLRHEHYVIPDPHAVAAQIKLHCDEEKKVRAKKKHEAKKLNKQRYRETHGGKRG